MKTITTKRGRDAGTGQFITIEEAQRRAKTAIVQTLDIPAPPHVKTGK